MTHKVRISLQKSNGQHTFKSVFDGIGIKSVMLKGSNNLGKNELLQLWEYFAPPERSSGVIKKAIH